jgi:hypothetical protein
MGMAQRRIAAVVVTPEDLKALTPDDFAPGAKDTDLRLARSVAAELTDDENIRLGTVCVDQGAMTPGGREGENQDIAFVSVAVAELGVTLTLGIFADPHAGVFVDWLEGSSAIKILEGFEDFNLIVFDRTPENLDERYSGKRAAWRRQSRVVERIRIPTDDIEDDAIARLVASCQSLDWKWERIAFSIARLWPAAECVASGEAFVEDLVQAVRGLLPIVGRINYLARQTKTAKAPALDRASWRKPA